jgi:hypothetical protein
VRDCPPRGAKATHQTDPLLGGGRGGFYDVAELTVNKLTINTIKYNEIDFDFESNYAGSSVHVYLNPKCPDRHQISFGKESC